MHIDDIEVFYVTLPLRSPWRTSYGEDWEIHTILVRMASGDYEGWGEASPLRTPTYSPEYAGGVYDLITSLLAPLLVGQELPTAEALLDILAPYKGNYYAKAALESAWWTLQSALQGVPLHRLLGGVTRPVAAGADLGVQDSIDILLNKIENAIERGFKRVKLKVRRGWDLEVLQAVRGAFPDLCMHIDCNGGYELADIDFFHRIDRLNLAMIEQPLFHTDLYEHSLLQRQIETPICLDESIRSTRDLKLAIELGACKVVNVKYARVGGLATAAKLQAMAQEAGITCWVGSMLESAVGAGLNIELSTLPNFTYPNDLFESSYFFREDLSEEAITQNADCTFTPCTTPGTPYPPHMGKLAKYTERQIRFS